MFKLKTVSFASFFFPFLLAKVKADCQTIEYFFKKDKYPDFMTECEFTEPGSQCFGNLPFYSTKSGDKIGQLRYWAMAIPGKWSSKNKSETAYIGTDIMTFLDGSGQVTYAADDFSKHKPPHQYAITGGTGDFACAGGVIHQIGEDDDKLYRKLEVCTSCKL